MSLIWNLPKINLMPLKEIRDRRRIALLTSGPAFDAVRQDLELNITWQKQVGEATLSCWDKLMEDFEGEVIYAVGGGLPHDAAKYMGFRKDLPVISIPTALSVDAFFTWASGIREEGGVRYIETKVPDEMVLDLNVIARAPVGIRAAGIADVFSIATGSWDWEFAHERGMNPEGMRFIPSICSMAKDILELALDCAASAGAGDTGGLKQLLDCLALEVQLTNQIGHARPEEGSEHYFAYAVENLCGHGRPHGDLLGPGILLMMAAQGQDYYRVKKGLVSAGVPLGKIAAQDIHLTLLNLPGYCRKHKLPYSKAHELDITWVKELEINAVLGN